MAWTHSEPALFRKGQQNVGGGRPGAGSSAWPELLLQALLSTEGNWGGIQRLTCQG